CDALINNMLYVEDKGEEPPYGAFKYYSGATTVFCKDIFTFQYASDVEILYDADQLSSMVLDFQGVEVDGGVSYNTFYVYFPAFPDLEAYLWSSCPECDEVSTSEPEPTPTPSTYGGTPPVWVPDETTPTHPNPGVIL